MKFSKWKKTGGLFLSFVMTACITSAQDWTVITGRVTKVHQGAANFYTVIAQDGALGLQQIVQAHHTQIAQNQHRRQVAAVSPQQQRDDESQHAQRKGQVAHGVHKMQNLEQHGQSF